MMKKRLLSIFTSLSLTASALAMAVGAAPALAGSQDTATDFFVPEQIIENTKEDISLSTSGPAAVTARDTAAESNTEFGTPALLGDAVLMDALTGEGTEESPYLITSADDLFLMAHNVNSGIGNTAHYKLTCDIDLGGKEWAPIGHYTELDQYKVSFGGVFDGDGYTVSNFKITKDDTYYMGLFGFVCGGTIKNVNVDSANINVSFSSSQTLYIGALVGRMVTTVPDSLSSITKCNVSNSSITAKNLGTIYAGGIGGSVVSGEYKNASIFIAFSNVTDTDISISTEAKYHPTPKENEPVKPHVVRAGGFIGFISAQTDSTLTVINCSASADVFADASKSGVSQAMSGGMFSDIWTYEKNKVGGKASISSCYSEGTVTAHSDYYPYIAGGFAAQIYPAKDLIITDCYSSSDVSGKFLQAGGGDGNDPTAGGFMGQLFFDAYVTSYGKIIKNCYGAGNVKDLTHTDSTPKDYSFVGGFMGWSTASTFENCYRFEAQEVIGSDLNFTDFGSISVLSEQDSRYLDKYVGFDMDKTWEMDPEADYFYPTLRKKTGYANFVNNGVSFATDVFGENGRISEPAKVPAKAQTVEKVYIFDYWSLSENGSPFNFSGDTLTEDATFYAVFRSVPRQYKISFINNGSIYSSSSLDYGSVVRKPSGTPSKADDDRYYYTFSHWSDTENGETFDFSDYTVVGEKVFYAVYEVIDKTAWTGDVAEKFASGFGTQDAPYIIESAPEFALLAKVINENQAAYKNAYFALGNNINLGGKTWVPIGNSINNPFGANFDGRGYTVSNFKMASGQYGGLFGVVLNGNIKNLNIYNFEFIYTFTNSTKAYPAYAGVLAAYVRAENGGNVEISGIKIGEGKFNVTANIGYISKNPDPNDPTSGNMYAGNIAGFAIGLSRGTVNIHDCFATNAVSVTNNNGYAYSGGIVGKLYTGSGSGACLTRCYNTGKVSAISYNSSRAGGLVGYLFSYGSDYMSDGSEKKDDVNLSATSDDLDVMIKDCFAAADIYSHSIEFTSKAGIIAAECNAHANVVNTYYPGNKNISVEAYISSKTDGKSIDNSGTAIANTYFTDAEPISEKLGFDVANTWTFIDGYEYPVLKCMVDEKDVLKVISCSYANSTVNTSIQVVSPEQNFTVYIGVYNERNQLIAMRREFFTNTKTTEFNVIIENVKNAHYVVISAVDSSSLTPLFDSVKTQF